jgi:hypothetical protein
VKIIAGYWWNEKAHRKEYIIVHLPIRVIAYCKWCGRTADDKMHLIKKEEDYGPIEELYSSRCPCGGRKTIDISP